MAKKEKSKEKDELINEAQAAKAEETAEEQSQANEEAAKEDSKKEPTEVEKLTQELSSAKEAHIRTLAEYDNFRKRTQREKDAIYGDCKAKVISDILPVLDNFERAAANSADFEAYRKGIEMTFGSFCEVLKKLGVEAFGEPGDKFDPNIHNAVMHCEDENLEENVITDVFSKGYKLGDRVLRPAMVKVAN